MKIPQEIAEKISRRNKLMDEINSWFAEYEDIDGYDIDGYEIVSEPCGEEQLDGEYCDQRQIGEDTYSGDYYYPIEGNSKFVKISFWL